MNTNESVEICAMSLALKQRIIECLTNKIGERIHDLQTDISSQSEESANHGKSSSGDKHEVSREMAAFEIDRLKAQLGTYTQMLHAIENTNMEQKSKVINGALVELNIGWIFLIAGFGKIIVDNIPVVVVSESAPLALTIKNRNSGDAVNFGQKELQILSIW